MYVCANMLVEVREQLLAVNSLLPPYGGRFSSVVSTVLCCVFQAGWPASFWEILVSLSISPYEC